ncbi:MAG TPA: DUF1858 domain-containing protein [Candidatus Marinimicrobia bacterium]|nr:DUF1858 domain-containing protein [Candidatus Neomarinimicrobiota bacterium]
MDITPKTKLMEILNAYPELEEKVIAMAPPFKNLKNPILRKTVGKLATLAKVAHIGGLDVREFVNDLRSEVGLAPLEGEVTDDSFQLSATAPDWIKGEPKHIVDGTAMLDAGEHPLNRVNELMSEISPGEHILLKTNFIPLPMIDAMKKQNYKVYHTENEGNQHQTFILKL